MAALTETQKRILEALSRPLRDEGPYATPATNQQIADEVFLSVDAVKGHLRALYSKFGLESLPQNQKRARLAELVLSGNLPVEPGRVQRLLSLRPALPAAATGALLLALLAVPAGALILAGGDGNRERQAGAGSAGAPTSAGGERSGRAGSAPATEELLEEALPSEAPLSPGDEVLGSYETVLGTIGSEPALLGPAVIEEDGAKAGDPPMAPLIRRGPSGPPNELRRRAGAHRLGAQEAEPPPAAPLPAPPAVPSEPPRQSCFDHVHKWIHPHLVLRRRVFIHPHVRRRRVSWIHEHVRLHRHTRVRIVQIEHIHTWLHQHTRLHVHANGRRHQHEWLHEHSRVHVHEVPRERVRIHRHVKPHEHVGWRREVVRRHRHVEVEREQSDHVHRRVHRHCA